METPSSTRRVTRSQTLSMSANNSILFSKKVEESDKVMTKSRKKSVCKQQQDRSALIDITNDSPIVGLALGNLKTPSSSSPTSKKRGHKFIRTPGSGEALLRGQVKTLLQKVEEEAELSKITLESRPVFNLVAPTPANTPHIFTNDSSLPLSLTSSPVHDNFNLIPQVVISDEKKHESEDVVITRCLLLDFSDKSSDSSKCSSVVAYNGEKISTDEDDDASSVWSIQVNAGSVTEECDDGGLLLDELCEGISNISVKECPKFMGKHIRFVYDSDDDEIEGGVEVM